ncbi:transposase [Streptomyces sp. A1136]|nr:transposase [Streptomyces sp. A1136]
MAAGQRILPAHAITVERVLTDNGSCCKYKLFTQTLTAAGIAHQRIRPYRPQINGKVERFNRTLLDEWAYQRPYTSNTMTAVQLRTGLPPWFPRVVRQLTRTVRLPDGVGRRQ